MTAEAPTPYLPRGAGGPLPRAAGRVSAPPVRAAWTEGPEPGGTAAPAAPVAILLEPDPLARLLVASAVAALGFSVAEGASAGGASLAPAAVFVSLERADDCRRACSEARRAGAGGDQFGGDQSPGRPAPLVVGYAAGAPALLAVHRVHRCADLVLRLTATAAGAPGLAHVPAAGAVTAAGLSEREADVLVLLLRGFTTAAVGARLCVASSTARTHCRAVLRKLGAGDRRALRALLLADPPPAFRDAGPEVCPVAAVKFAEESAVAALRPPAHT